MSYLLIHSDNVPLALTTQHPHCIQAQRLGPGDPDLAGALMLGITDPASTVEVEPKIPLDIPLLGFMVLALTV